MVPNGKGIWHLYKKVIKGKWTDGIHDDVNLKVKKTVNGFQTYSTWIERSYKGHDNKLGEVLLTANFVNGIVNGFGTYLSNEWISEVMFAHGQQYGRIKQIYIIGSYIINKYTYCMYEGGIKSLASNASRRELALTSKFVEYGHGIYSDSFHLENEEVTFRGSINVYSVSYRNSSLMHYCGIRNDSDDKHISISRNIYINGNVRYVFNIRTKLEYICDGGIESI